MKNFPSPHVHIASLDSASTPSAFAEREVALESTAITCTDHGTLSAIPEVYDLAKQHNLICIPGLEAYVRDDNCPILEKAGVQKKYKLDKDDKPIPGTGTFVDYAKYYHITMHAKDAEAYEAIVRALSVADFRAEQHGSERKPLFDWAVLEQLGQFNITMTSGCLIGMVQRHLLAGPDQMTTSLSNAFAYYERLRSIPKPGNFYVELFPHRCDQKWVEGVFVTLEGGGKRKFWPGKKLKTTEGEFTAEALVALVARGKPAGKLIAVKNQQKWEDCEPKDIVECKYIAEFMQNECRDWAKDGDVQRGANKLMLQLAQNYGDKVLISDDAHFAVPEDKIVQDCRLGNWKFANSYHRQTADEALNYFRDVLGVDEKTVEGWVENNREWAQEFKDFSFKERKSLPTKFYPDNTLAHLKTLIDKHGRMDWNNQEWFDRLQSEIQLLHHNGTLDLLPYFFLAEEACYVYEQQKMLTGPGRGSAAGLLVTYLLGITHVDPIKYKLSQDRFLTVDRIKSGKLPDIDMDFPDRDLLTAPEDGWLYKRFGDHVAAISTDTKLRLKSSIKDVCRYKRGRVLPELEALCKKLPNPPQGVEDYDFIFGYTGEDGKEVRGLIDESAELQKYAQDFSEDWGIVKKMLGITRQKSRHACAYVIANEPIHHFIPLTTISGVRTTQYDAKGVEARGGLKMDFLGLNSLKDIQTCITLVQESYGKAIEKDHVIDGKRVPGFRMVPFNGRLYDVWDLPVDDQLKGEAFDRVVDWMHEVIDKDAESVDLQAVFRDIAEGKTETVFQLNTPSARQWLKQFNFWKSEPLKMKAIDSIEAVSAFTALDRPGPLDAEVKDASGKAHNMLVEYANRAKGLPPVGNIPALDAALPETYGVMVYQEQLEAMYRELTGCSAAEAEEFRRNVAKKKMDKVKKVYPAFMERASAKIGAEQAQAVFDQMVTFGQYGFNRSHSACYAVIAVACAFLKHHYPTQWWCAVLRNADKKEIGEKFWKHCKHLVDLPDIRHSGAMFEIQNGRIRAPLSFLQGVGDGAHNELVEYRPYTTIEDLCRKINQRKSDTKKPAFEKNGKPKLDKNGNQRYRMGTSALHAGVINKLIVSGVADSLFPEDTPLTAKLYEFNNQMAATANELNGTRKKPEKIKPEYLDLTAFRRYQLQKEILPIYSEPLQDHLFAAKYSGVFESKKGETKYLFMPATKAEQDAIRTQKGGPMYTSPIPIVDGPELKYLNTKLLAEEEKEVLTTAAVGYVLEERRFRYGDKKQNEALDLTFDVNGETFSFVKWPDRDTKKLIAPPPGLVGAIVLVILTRTRNARPYTIDAIAIVQQPLEQSKEEEKEEESS
jgi:DNA-directed DNA polymerase III PolC